MELSHLLSLVSELPHNSTLQYVRGTDECRFLDVDIEGKRINSIAPNGENKSWAPTYLESLAPKIFENEPFNLSGLLNNKGSYRPVLETIIAHTREFYSVRKGSAVALVWIPSRPKSNLTLEEISEEDIPAPKRSVTADVIIKNELKEEYSSDELVEILKNMNEMFGSLGVHLFGLKFGRFIESQSINDIVAAAGLTNGYITELSKMRKVYKAISDKMCGLAFYENLRPLSEIVNSEEASDTDNSFLRAMRTKPFLLLAGISGTGKSRIVKQMAFDSCPDNSKLRSDLTSPGNYCLIEVKPNWHDSTELLGYESKIGGAHYQLTPFIKFLTKAMLYPEVPFFVCLDEMNLAPVEQYFAEFLSVLESRTKINGHIVSEPLISADVFANKDYELKLQDDLFGLELKEEITDDGRQRIISGKLSDDAQPVYDSLKENGLRIPENVIVIGTVNMDETTHQFSRKVIDRAMTIEMNLPEGNPFMDFFDKSSELAYRKNPSPASLYLPTETKAADVVNELSDDNAEKTDWLKQQVADFLTGLNNLLDGTPFKIAYRVQNELMLYFYQLWLEDKTARWRDILVTAADQILMMKVLPRIEGDDELLQKPLEALAAFCEPYPNASKKVNEMKSRLEKARFTSFWP